MPQVTATARVACPPDVAFAVSQTTGALRLRWDPFIRNQYLLDGARTPGKGVRTQTVSRYGIAMISRYVSYRPPAGPDDRGTVGMTMVTGPWFFATFGGGWRFVPTADGGTEAVWKYTFSCRPAWLRRVAEAIGRRVLGRDIRRRIDAFARACADPVILAAVAGPG